MNQATHGSQPKNKSGIAKADATEAVNDATETVKERLEQARDMLEDARDKAVEAFRERPYLAPFTAGAVGFGLGILCGSRLARFVVVTAIGAVVSDVVGGEVKRLAGDFMKDMQHRLSEGEGDAKETPATE